MGSFAAAVCASVCRQRTDCDEHDVHDRHVCVGGRRRNVSCRVSIARQRHAATSFLRRSRNSRQACNSCIPVSPVTRCDALRTAKGRILTCDCRATVLSDSVLSRLVQGEQAILAANVRRSCSHRVSPQDVIHQCPNCHQTVGIYRRM